MPHGAALLFVAASLTAPPQKPKKVEPPPAKVEAPAAKTEAPAAKVEAPAATGEVLTLEQALSEAVKRNTQIANATLQVQRSEKDISAAKTYRYLHAELEVLGGRTIDQVEVIFPGGALGAFPATGPIPAADIPIRTETDFGAFVNGTVAQPLTQLYRVNLGVKAQRVNRDINKEKLRAEKATIVNLVRRLYHAILQAQGAVAVAEEQVGASRELLRVVGDLLDRKAALPSDRLDAQTGLAGNEYKLLVARNALAGHKERMNALLGREITRGFSVVAVPDSPVEAEIGPAVRRALDQRPEVKQAKLAVDLADTDRKIKRAENIPDLSLAFRYLTAVNVQLVPRNVATFGLLLKWEPLDWGRRHKQAAEKGLQVQQARNFASAAEDQVRIDVATKVRALQEAKLLLEAARLGRESATEKLRVTRDKYKEQAALLTEVLQAQAALGTANDQYDQAMLAYWAARADLERATGEDY
jgi:outer membrane protein TolC